MSNWETIYQLAYSISIIITPKLWYLSPVLLRPVPKTPLWSSYEFFFLQNTRKSFPLNRSSECHGLNNCSSVQTWYEHSSSVIQSQVDGLKALRSHLLWTCVWSSSLVSRSQTEMHFIGANGYNAVSTKIEQCVIFACQEGRWTKNLSETAFHNACNVSPHAITSDWKLKKNSGDFP